MRRHHIKLLVTLVLTAALAIAAWGNAHARPRSELAPHSWTTQSVMKPGATPNSGDPDAGGTGKDSGGARLGGLAQPDPEDGTGHVFVRWLRWAGWVWVALKLRAAL